MYCFFHLRQRPCYAKVFYKRIFIYMVWPTVHTNPSEVRSFSKTLYEVGGIWKRGFSFSCGRKTLSIEKTMASRYSCDFPERDFLKHKSNLSGDCYYYYYAAVKTICMPYS